MPAHYLDTRVPTCVRALYSGCYVVTPLIIIRVPGARGPLVIRLAHYRANLSLKVPFKHFNRTLPAGESGYPES